MEEDGYKVVLHVYDLSQGLARQLSTTFLGKAIDGIWHTGIVVYGNEYYFGGGIQHSPVGATPYGRPLRIVDLGVSHVPKEVFEEYLVEINPRYTAETYNLLQHNCNNFSNEVSQFLVGATIPDYILQLPNEVMNSPMGAMIMPMIQQLETTLRAGAVPQAPQFRPNSSSAQATVPRASYASTTPTNSPNLSLREASKDSSTTNSTCTASSQESVDEPEKPVAAENALPPDSAKDTTRKANGVFKDPLGDARTKVQEEIGREFAALMATGTLRASEAAALATRRVMEKHGRLNVAAPRS